MLQGGRQHGELMEPQPLALREAKAEASERPRIDGSTINPEVRGFGGGVGVRGSGVWGFGALGVRGLGV